MLFAINGVFSYRARACMNRFAAFVIAVLAVLLPPYTAKADNSFQSVSGTFATQAFTGPGCPSPLNQCSSGTATGDLTGDVLVAITSTRQIVDSTGTPYLLYTATIAISNSSGRLDGVIAGRINLMTGVLQSGTVIVGGTGAYSGRVGFIASNGIFSPTGAEVDEYSGYLTTN